MDFDQSFWLVILVSFAPMESPYFQPIKGRVLEKSVKESVASTTHQYNIQYPREYMLKDTAYHDK